MLIENLEIVVAFISLAAMGVFAVWLGAIIGVLPTAAEPTETEGGSPEPAAPARDRERNG